MKALVFFLLYLLAIAACYPILQEAASWAKSLATTSASSKAQANVKQAAAAFASDVGTVSNSLNSLATATSTSSIKSLAQSGFNAEEDEDSHRAVLNSAAGSAGSTANGKIVKFTPTVLNGLKAIVKSPTTDTVKSNLSKIQSAR
jgi:hypothetical protein